MVRDPSAKLQLYTPVFDNSGLNWVYLHDRPNLDALLLDGGHHPQMNAHYSVAGEVVTIRFEFGLKPRCGSVAKAVRGVHLLTKESLRRMTVK